MRGFSKSDESSVSGTEVWDVQAPFLEQLWRSGGELLRRQGGIQDAAQQYSDEFLGSMRASLGSLGALAAGTTPGQAYLADTLGDVNPYLDATIDALGADISRFTDRQIGTTIAGGTAGGAFGSSRHGIREGMALEAGAEEFAQGATALRAQDYSQQAARAQALTDSLYQGAFGLGATAPGAYDLGMAPYSAAWLPLTSYAMTLGAPTTLGHSRSEGSSFGLSL